MTSVVRRAAVLLAIATIVLFVWRYYQTSRPATTITSLPVPASDDLPVMHRTNLLFAGGYWLVPGQSNTFTGMLLDTYDDGAKKSYSTVSNGILEGLSIGWHTNGQQQVEEHFVGGTSHGLRIKWYPDGQKLSEVSIVNGKLHGLFRRWHENGTIAEEIELVDGQPDGMSRAYYPSGFQKAEVLMKTGSVVSQKFWEDGERK
jgi:antitoxin component YwqK of YwqJK toxin-antitoxin module